MLGYLGINGTFPSRYSSDLAAIDAINSTVCGVRRYAANPSYTFMQTTI